MSMSLPVAITVVAGEQNSNVTFFHSFLTQFLWSKILVRAPENPVRLVFWTCKLAQWFFHCGHPCCGSMTKKASWTQTVHFCTHFWLNACDLKLRMKPSFMPWIWYLDCTNWMSSYLVVATPVMAAWSDSWAEHKAFISSPNTCSICVIKVPTWSPGNSGQNSTVCGEIGWEVPSE